MLFISRFIKILLFIPIFFITSPLFSETSETEYGLDLKTELTIGAVSASLFAPLLFVDPGHSETKSKNDINSLDRKFMYQYNKALDLTSTVGVVTVITMPILSVSENIKDFDFLGTYFVMYAEAILLTTATKDLLKRTTSRNRPYTYKGEIPSGKEDDYYLSFPSAHTAYAFLGAAFFATTFSKEFPDSKWKTPLIIGGYSLAASAGALRIASGNHFVTDVLAGAFIGTFYGWFIPNLHLKQKNKESELLVMPAGNSVLFAVSF